MRKLNPVLKVSAVLVLAFCFSGQTLPAAKAERASGTEIITALSGRTAFEAGKTYRPWRQFFAIDGTTVYFADGPSSAGLWEVRGDQYCSVWPPAVDWACYDVQLTPKVQPFSSIVWISKDGTQEVSDLYDGDLTAERTLPKR